MLRLYGWIEQERRADSTGVMSSLLLEIVNVYPALHPPSLTAHASNRVCNALALLQCVASHSETRSLFLNGMSKLSRVPLRSFLLLVSGAVYGGPCDGRESVWASELHLLTDNAASNGTFRDIGTRS